MMQNPSHSNSQLMKMAIFWASIGSAIGYFLSPVSLRAPEDFVVFAVVGSAGLFIVFKWLEKPDA